MIFYSILMKIFINGRLYLCETELRHDCEIKNYKKYRKHNTDDKTHGIISNKKHQSGY